MAKKLATTNKPIARDKDKPIWRRKTGIYCSPACNCGCTRAEYEKANRDGRALARSLGADWTFEVWENMGWHYHVTKGPVVLHNQTYRGRVSGYWADVTLSEIQITYHHEDARAAVTGLVNKLLDIIKDGAAISVLLRE